MNRYYLTNAVRTIATAKGYEFVCAPQEYANSMITHYPAAMLTYPQFCEMEGRNRGKITYRLTLSLLRDGSRLAPTERERAVGELEEDMLALFSSLSQCERVVEVRNLTIAPPAKTLTTHGEIAISATADVVSIFIRA